MGHYGLQTGEENAYFTRNHAEFPRFSQGLRRSGKKEATV
jgi:hypothetical protein